MKKVIAIFALVLHASLCAAQYYVTSPNREIRVSLNTNRDRSGWSAFLVPTKMTMKVSNYTQDFVNREINIIVKSKGKRYSFGKSNMKNVNKGNGFVDAPDAIDSTFANLKGRYNTITLASENGIILEVRAYNNGVAYRFRVTGYPEDYKILEQTNVFPGESPVAIVGTFEGEYVSPWHVLKIRVEEFNPETGKTPTNTISPTYHRGKTVVPWRDALSSITIGTSFDFYNGDTWKGMTDTQSIHADMTYKSLYGGVSVMRCQGNTAASLFVTKMTWKHRVESASEKVREITSASHVTTGCSVNEIPPGSQDNHLLPKRSATDKRIGYAVAHCSNCWEYSACNWFNRIPLTVTAVI